MNTMSSSISFFLLATLCLTVQYGSHVVRAEAPTPGGPGPNFIEKACERAPYKPLCINTLSSDPNGKKSDLQQLAFIAFRSASKYAAETSAMVRKALLDDDDNVIDTSEERIMSDCSESYNSIVDQIDDSMDALVTGPGKDVEKEINAAIAAIDTCAGSIDRLGGKSLDVNRKNQRVKQLCENALSIYHVFAKN